MRKGLIAAAFAVLAWRLSRRSRWRSRPRLGAACDLHERLARLPRAADRAGRVPRPGAAFLAAVRRPEVQPGERHEVQGRGRGRHAAQGSGRADGRTEVRVRREDHGRHRRLGEPGRARERQSLRECEARIHLRAPRRRSTSRRAIRTDRSSAIIPNDAIQGPDIVGYVVEEPQGEERRDHRLAGRLLRPAREARSAVASARGTSTSPASPSRPTTPTSRRSSRTSGRTSTVVIFATQVASAANTLSNQLREQGKKAIVFGTDGAYSPSQFKPRSGYVSVFAPDLHFDRKAAAVIAAYTEVRDEGRLGCLRAGDVHGGLCRHGARSGRRVQTAARRARKSCRRRRSTNVPSIIGDNIRFDCEGRPQAAAASS